MSKNKHKTRVVFRVWRPSDGGSVIALFPEINEGHGKCQSYEHVGQHCPADYTGCVASSRPAKPEEYAALARELEGLGYNLDVRKRRHRQ